MDEPLTVQQRQDRLLVLIPCLNEAGRIGKVVRSVRDTLPGADILVVNDASSDGSADEAESEGARVVTHPSVRGYEAALQTGYRHAVEAGYDLVLQMDADGQHRADQLPLLLSPIREAAADIVLGSRYGGAGGETPSFWKRVGHRVVSLIFFLFSGQRLTDPTSGFQGLNQETLRLFAGGRFPSAYPNAAVLLTAHMAGLRIREVRVRMDPRAGGKSMHAGARAITHGIGMVASLIMVWLRFRMGPARQRAPVARASGRDGFGGKRNIP